MTSRETGLCNGIIHSASAAAAAVGAGMAQMPASDNAIITPIQLTMAVSLGKVFGITLDQSAAKAAVASAAAATAAIIIFFVDFFICRPRQWQITSAQ